MQIRTPYVARMFEHGVADDGTPYLVMELLAGNSLRDVMQAEAPMAVDRACRIICEILGGVGAAHQAGIVHRDLKPDNVFVARKGKREVIKILDFGVSLLKRPNVPDTRLTSLNWSLDTGRTVSLETLEFDGDLKGSGSGTITPNLRSPRGPQGLVASLMNLILRSLWAILSGGAAGKRNTRCK